MPTNESMVAVPLNVEEAGETRKFLLRLVEKLDIVFGYRGNDPFVTVSQLNSTTEGGLTQLEKTILAVITALVNDNSSILNELITTLSDETTDAIDALKSSTTVDDADDSTQVLSAGYVQAEVQSIQDQVVDVATQLNELLAALRATGIIAT